MVANALTPNRKSKIPRKLVPGRISHQTAGHFDRLQLRGARALHGLPGAKVSRFNRGNNRRKAGLWELEETRSFPEGMSVDGYAGVLLHSRDALSIRSPMGLV